MSLFRYVVFSRVCYAQLGCWEAKKGNERLKDQERGMLYGEVGGTGEAAVKNDW